MFSLKRRQEDYSVLRDLIRSSRGFSVGRSNMHTPR